MPKAKTKRTRQPSKPAFEVPTLERAQHDPIELVAERDPEGWNVKHARCVDTLGAMFNKGTISAAMLRAGRRLASDFQVAQLDPIRAQDYSQQRCGASMGGTSEMVQDAKNRVYEAMESMGGASTPCGSAAWFIIGCGMTITEWARRQVLGKGASLDTVAARGVLVGSLGALDAYYDRDRNARYISGTAA